MSSITILIPTCNRPAQLRRALASCYAQKTAPAEVLVIDNGSDPATRRVVAAFQERHGATLVYERSKPFNVRTALARGIELATSEWLIQLDDDDFLAPDRLEYDERMIAETPPDVVVLAHHFLRVDYQRDIVWMHRMEPEKLTLSSALCLDHFGPLASTTIRTAAACRHHPYRLPDGIPDFDLLASVLQHGRVRHCDGVGYIMDDTRRAGRMTMDRHRIRTALLVHAERYGATPQRGVSNTRNILRRIAEHRAFYAARNFGWSALWGADKGCAWRHPIHFANGLLAPWRPLASRFIGDLLPVMRGSTQFPLARFSDAQAVLASWIKTNANPAL